MSKAQTLSLQQRRQRERGDVALYIAIVMAAIMISSTAVFAVLLARQITLTKDIVASERALQATDAGAEHILWRLSRGTLSGPDEEITLDTTIAYPAPEASAEYRACGQIGPVFRVVGTYQGLSRRLASGNATCTP